MTDKSSGQEKLEAPEAYKSALRRARMRVLRRDHGPIVDVVPGEQGLSCPFADVEEDWQMLILNTFATRSLGVANVFIRHLSELCATAWDEKTRMWVPDQDQLTTVLHIVAAHKRVCRMHGGTNRGAPSGVRNGAYLHGGETKEAVALRSAASRLLRSIGTGKGA